MIEPVCYNVTLFLCNQIRLYMCILAVTELEATLLRFRALWPPRDLMWSGGITAIQSQSQNPHKVMFYPKGLIRSLSDLRADMNPVSVSSSVSLMLHRN